MYRYVVFAISVLACGCSVPTATTVTVVHRDGSFTRRVELSPSPGVVDGKAAPSHRVAAKEALAKEFGVRWSDGHLVRPRRKGEQAEWVSHRGYARGQVAVHDVVIRSDHGEDIVANEASVRPMGDGRWVFSERYHRIGGPLQDRAWLSADVRRVVKAALGPGFDSSEIDTLSIRLTKDSLRVLFEPQTLARLGKYTGKDANVRASEELVRLIEQRLNQQATSDAERAASHRLAMTVIAPKGGPFNSKELSRTLNMAPNTEISVKVRVPGKVLRTDAALDNDGLWSWEAFSGALLVDDLQFRLIYRP